MKVKDLITQLEGFEPDANVVITKPDGGLTAIVGVGIPEVDIAGETYAALLLDPEEEG